MRVANEGLGEIAEQSCEKEYTEAVDCARAGLGEDPF